MISFDVKDMSCGHCAAAITRAVQAADAGATVDIDLASHRVRIAPVRADAPTLVAAIRDAGFTPVPA